MFGEITGKDIPNIFRAQDQAKQEVKYKKVVRNEKSS
jgi:hypothetical protein